MVRAARGGNFRSNDSRMFCVDESSLLFTVTQIQGRDRRRVIHVHKVGMDVVGARNALPKPKPAGDYFSYRLWPNNNMVGAERKLKPTPQTHPAREVEKVSVGIQSDPPAWQETRSRSRSPCTNAYSF